MRRRRAPRRRSPPASGRARRGAEMGDLVRDDRLRARPATPTPSSPTDTARPTRRRRRGRPTARAGSRRAITYSFGLITPRLHRESLDGRVERGRLALDELAARRSSPSRSGRRTSRPRRREVRPEPTNSRSEAVAAELPAERRRARRRTTARQPHAFSRFRTTISVRPTARSTRRRRSSPSSSARARGGQSGSGASQRLEQWREATFWSGIRMCPFSSTCATSST